MAPVGVRTEVGVVVEASLDQVNNGRLRDAARFERWRPDKDPENCTLKQLARAAGQSIAEDASHSRRRRQTSSPFSIGTMSASTRSSARALSSIGCSVSRWLMALSATRMPPGTMRGTTAS